MAYRIQASFAKGELDPALQERITLDAYDNGLNTGRNILIGKTGRILSRPGRKFVRSLVNGAGSDETKKVKLFPTIFGTFIQMGDQYIIHYDEDGTELDSDTTDQPYTEDELKYLSMISVDRFRDFYLFLFSSGIRSLLCFGGNTITLTRPQNIAEEDFFIDTYQSSPSMTVTVNGSTGYDVDYLVTNIVNGGQEYDISEEKTTGKLPINTGESNTIERTVPNSSTFEGINVYRRPRNGGAYGYIGSSVAASGTKTFTFIDHGGDADFTQGPPELVQPLEQDGTDPNDLKSRRTLLYQGRVVLFNYNEIYFSNILSPRNMYRDFPLNTGSALSVKLKGVQEILWAIESDGLIVFTRTGVYVHRGIVSPENLNFEKVGDWEIDEDVPPISVPGGVFFVDASSNVVRRLVFSTERSYYVGEEVSIFSDHLFRNSKITSWAFERGVTPVLWVTYDDGTYSAFTYEDTHELRAWTRCDSGSDIEQVIQIKPWTDLESSPINNVDSRVLFLVNDGTNRYIEKTVRRAPTVKELADNPEADKGETIAAMDAMVSWSALLNDDLTDDDITLTPVTAGDWEGNLTLAVTDDAIFPDPGAGEVGTVFRHFHPVDRTEVDLEIVSRTDDNTVVVEPSAEFPSDYATNPRLYKTKNTFDGLDHLDGKDVAIVADGYVLASPNNNIEDYPTVTVASGEVNLPDSYLGAIVHIGLPYTMDVETLDVHSVEQRPTLIESVTVNRLYVKTYESRGLYIGNRFPDDDKVKGTDENAVNMVVMDGQDAYDVNYEEEDPITGNRYQQPTTKRHEVVLPGDWKSNGRICIRQVDPVHFEILSIIPDIDDQER